MKVIIAGSRDNITKVDVVKAITLADYDITEVVSGTARGVDRWGEEIAKDANIPIKRMPANWNEFGKAAGFIRNGDMADYADALIAIWDGESKGTKNMIQTMKLLHKPVYVYNKQEQK